jgi:O-antigen/teichoic acid export membrane protein
VLLHHIKKYDIKTLIPEFRKYQKYTIYGAITLTILLILTRRNLIEMLGKLEFTTEMNNAFLLVILISFMRFIYGNYEMFLVRIQKQNLRFWVMLIAGVTSIVSIFILVPRFDLIGAVFTNVISNFVVLLGVFYISEKSIKKIKTNKKL